MGSFEKIYIIFFFFLQNHDTYETMTVIHVIFKKGFFNTLYHWYSELVEHVTVAGQHYYTVTRRELYAKVFWHNKNSNRKFSLISRLTHRQPARKTEYKIHDVRGSFANCN